MSEVQEPSTGSECDILYNYDDIKSPLYDSSEHTAFDYQPMEFQCTPGSNQINTITSRKTIYGEDYNISEVLRANTRADPEKLDQLKFEVLATTSTRKYHQSHGSAINDAADFLSHAASENLHESECIASQSYKQLPPAPTKTTRNYTKITIDYNDIPQLCSKCYSVECFCAIIFNLSNFH